MMGSVMSRIVSLSGVFIILIFSFSSNTSNATSNECKSRNLSPSVGITQGETYRDITERCIRRIANGVRVTCDSGEVAISVLCELNGSPGGKFSALVTSGVMGTRTGVCLWSAPVDATAVVNCKRLSILRYNASGDEYERGMEVPKHDFEPAERAVKIVHICKKRRIKRPACGWKK